MSFETTYMAVCVREETVLAAGQLMEWDDDGIPLVKPFAGRSDRIAGWYVPKIMNVDIGPVPSGMRGIFICSDGLVTAQRNNRIAFGTNG